MEMIYCVEDLLKAKGCRNFAELQELVESINPSVFIKKLTSSIEIIHELEGDEVNEDSLSYPFELEEWEASIPEF